MGNRDHGKAGPQGPVRAAAAQKTLDGRRPGGRLRPVFPALLTGSKKEEEYVARMVARDRELRR